MYRTVLKSKTKTHLMAWIAVTKCKKHQILLATTEPCWFSLSSLSVLPQKNTTYTITGNWEFSVLTCEDVRKAAGRNLSTGRPPGGTDGLAASFITHQIFPWTFRVPSLLLFASQPPLKFLRPVGRTTQRPGEASGALPSGCCPANSAISGLLLLFTCLRRNNCQQLSSK